MTVLTEYLLKVILCSGILTGYYWLALRNKIFHQWNRFYLLSVVLLSLTLPLLKLQFWYQPAEQTATSYKVLQTITTNDTWFEKEVQTTVSATTYFTTERISTYLYLFVSLLILAGFLKALADIFRLYKKYQHWKTEQLVFVDTDAKGTPFSFFNYIFWNRNIVFESIQGQQIFAHELVHVKEKHSWDKLLLNLLLIAFWINPFFWLIRKELSMIHEFIADKKAVQDQDSSALAAMILATAFPGHTLPFTNPFFYSPIKRRLLMLSKLQNPKVGYISRLLLLPLLTILFTAFALKIKEKEVPSTIPRLAKSLTVVIDAGHGLKNGVRHGAIGQNGVTEDEIALAITKKIEQLNTDKNLNLIFTRTDENFIENKERVRIAEANNADLFISLHASYAPPVYENGKPLENKANGFELYVSKDGSPYLSESKKLGSAIIAEMQSLITIRQPGIKQRKAGIWVVDASPCPSVLLECGFISNSNDAAFLSNEKNQEKIAKAVLKGIVNYAANTGKSVISSHVVADTIPLPSKGTTTLISDSITFKNIANTNQLVIINGKKADRKMRNSLKISSVKRVTLIKENDKEAILKYGPEAKNGVIIFEEVVIEEKKLTDATEIPASTPIFTKAEIMPQFPGGENALTAYIIKKIEANIRELMTNNPTGKCELTFIVSKDGEVSNFTLSHDKQDSNLAGLLVESITTGPKWTPAFQNGRNVAAKKKLTVSYHHSTNEPVEYFISVKAG